MFERILPSLQLPFNEREVDDFSLMTSVVDGAFRVSIRGELDLATRGLVRDACLRGDQLPVVADLEQTTFMDSAGYRDIEAACDELKRRGGAFTLRHVHGQPARLISLLSTLRDSS